MSSRSKSVRFALAAAVRGRTILVGAGAFALVAGGSAQATTYTLNLTGEVSQFQESSFYFQGNNYQSYSLDLSGLDSSNSITVYQGDVIDATVTLDQPYIIPASTSFTNLLFYLSGSNFPNENTGVSGTFTLYDGNSVVGSFDYGSSSANILSSYAYLPPPENTAYTITGFTINVDVDSLATPATLDGANFTYQLGAAGTPEPAAWAMLMLGVSAVGATLRSRRRALSA